MHYDVISYTTSTAFSSIGGLTLIYLYARLFKLSWGTTVSIKCFTVQNIHVVYSQLAALSFQPGHVVLNTAEGLLQLMHGFFNK